MYPFPSICFKTLVYTLNPRVHPIAPFIIQTKTSVNI